MLHKSSCTFACIKHIHYKGESEREELNIQVPTFFLCLGERKNTEITFHIWLCVYMLKVPVPTNSPTNIKSRAVLKTWKFVNCEWDKFFMFSLIISGVRVSEMEGQVRMKKKTYFFRIYTAKFFLVKNFCLFFLLLYL